MLIAFEHCKRRQVVDSTALSPGCGWLRCQDCGECPTGVDVSDAASWIERQAANKLHRAARGQLASRKQAGGRSDYAIDRDGISAELAACSLLCPAFLVNWMKAAESLRNNRGRDLLRSWTGLGKPVEVKHTRYQDDSRGYLLVRPPRNTPGRMRAEYLDDAYYLLMGGAPYMHAVLGWIDRAGLRQKGQLNPVPVRGGQRECWGLHWSRLRPLDELTAHVGKGGRPGSVFRWLADACDTVIGSG